MCLSVRPSVRHCKNCSSISTEQYITHLDRSTMAVCNRQILFLKAQFRYKNSHAAILKEKKKVSELCMRLYSKLNTFKVM